MDYVYELQTGKIVPVERETPMGRVTESAFKQLNKEDIAWLEDNTECCLERMRIISMLKDSTRMYYEVEPKVFKLEHEIKQLKKQISDLQWETNPDRMGK